LKLVGIDLLPNAISYCLEKYKDIPEMTFLVKDVHHYNEPVDIIMCNLVCHHLYDDFLEEVLLKFKNLAILGFVINDLERNSLAYYSIKWLTKLFSKSYLVKNDAPLSVAKGFLTSEWNSLFNKLGISPVFVTWQWAFRHLIVYKNG
jgi:hypothetical protein